MDDIIRRPKKPRIQLDNESASIEQEAVLDSSSLEPALGRLAMSQPPDIEYSVEDYEEEPEPEPEEPRKKGKKNKKGGFKLPTPHTKLQWLFTVLAILIALGGTGFAVYWFVLRDTTPPLVIQEPEPEPEPLPEPVYSLLSGREITDPKINDRPIYAVQIENSQEARHQSGLKEASIVTEMIAEGGITRFNAIYQDQVPKNIGPIRSLRPYFIDTFLPYDAAIMHAGGSGEALSLVRKLGLKDLDECRAPCYQRRISERYAPHNLYSTGKQVLDTMADRNYKLKSSIKWLTRKDSAPVETATAKTINIRISRDNWNVKYTYDKSTNTYLREHGGAKHLDNESKKQLAPDVVIVPIMRKGAHPDGVHTQYTTTGSGKVYVFQDGTVTIGTWSKKNRSSQWVLKDNKGKEIALNRGQTWFTVTDAASNVSYKP